ncbi:hypothetical protein Lepto7376_0781 [[Leptolyngbya] sp. PCC 7376]|uniref:hypothetical protein n=1 Tax=[Leptolyngbya] sp. PCC 7376 TaxID=111781 RepID=UPI00029ECAE9|nr:hypothetical protein [[Leptolyngbya] sp. PCC 7376]AFY37178.1 hypothetical protein Lepto7376_0781 [[Leptolyngbya] sp. PCC 7376]
MVKVRNLGSKQFWLKGKSCSGKTTRLVAEIQRHHDLKSKMPTQKSPTFAKSKTQQSMLVFAATNRTQRELADAIQRSLQGEGNVVSKTPLGFMADEVELFFPIICGAIALKPAFSLRLRPELEQKYATELWEPTFEEWELNLSGRSLGRLVRRLLDLLQLAGAAGVAPEEIGERLEAGQLSVLSGSVVYGQDDLLAMVTAEATDLLLKWRDWCLERSFLTYGIIYELYWRYLLPNATYQGQLIERFDSIWADDVHDYPAIAKDLCDVFLDADCAAMFTTNPDGQTRLGLNADPNYLGTLATRCEEISIAKKAGLAESLGEILQTQLTQPGFSEPLPKAVQSIQSLSRTSLLQNVITEIQRLIKDEKVLPEEIAIIAPGLDEVARYTLMQSLGVASILVEPLSEQRPLYSSPWGRSPVTLLALLYPHCGRLIQTSEVAELLIMLSQTAENEYLIDPVRAGLLVDYCYQPDPEHPKLLPANTMPRGDRLGYQVTTAYEEIRQWIEEQKAELDMSPLGILTTLDQAIRYFFVDRLSLNYEQSATLRELTETCQHFYKGDRRCHPTEPETSRLPELIKLLQGDLISTNPRPQFAFNRNTKPAITLATIFQYRSARLRHCYQFWLDAGSRLWEKGGAATLFGYGVFQRDWDGEPWSIAAETTQNQQRLQRIVQDLIGRCSERIYLCHSDLSVNGNEQMGPLLPLIQSAQDCTLELKSP